MEQMDILSPTTPMDSPGEFQRLMNFHATRLQDENDVDDRPDDINMMH